MMWSASSSVLVAIALLSTTVHALANITLILPSTHLSPNPSLLPPSTHANLISRSATYSVLINRQNTFEFADITSGSYLLNIQCRDLVFAPFRVDVEESGTYDVVNDDDDQNSSSGKGTGDRIRVWQTFTGNAWSNKGEKKGESNTGHLTMEVRPDKTKNYYMERAGFSPLDLFKNPMILLALVSLGLIVGMPYLIDSMDDETKEEFEQIQSKSPLTQATNPTSLSNFDFAAWMAGKPSDNTSGSTSANKESSGSAAADLRRRG